MGWQKVVAKARKSAIAGVARPEGFLDDVVYPIVQKAARKASGKYPRAFNIENDVSIRRQVSYIKKEKKNLYKMEDKLALKKPKEKMSKSAFKYSKKSGVAAAKEKAIAEGRSVRRAAKRTRQDYR